MTAVLRRDRAHTGARLFDPHRDLKQVTELIAAAFSDRLGPDGDIVLAEMRRIARWHSFLGWLYWPGPGGGGVAPGFVWVEQGRLVGNISLRRARQWGGFFVGNVAVHPDWQRRGIGSALMEVALDEISRRKGRWVGLEVRADNQVARGLYERMGFREVGRTLHMLRPAGLSWTGCPPSHPSLRRGRSRDSAALIELMHAVVPRPQRPLLELREEDYRPGWERTLDRWLEGQHEVWWVMEENGVLCGAVRVLREHGRRPDRVELLVSPQHSGPVGDVLVRQSIAGLRGASKKMVESVLPSPTEPLIRPLEATGFQRLRVLVQMRLDLSQRIAIQAK